MKIYRSKKDGVTVWRLIGVVQKADAAGLVRAMKGTAKRLRGCHVLDFTDVVHVDYHAFRTLEDRIPADAGIVLSGLSDYVLDIFAFAQQKRHLVIYSDWREALQYIRFDRGKILAPASHDFAGFK
ncbi:MAG TPA: hypothetical protein VMX58_01960 [Patescibacteria group bacterium]|nr:hypothetical protein [Patescibacteria group bacterium]